MEESKRALPPPFIVWQEDYTAANGIIDQQHQRLVALINDLYEGIRSGTLPPMSAVLRNLEDYTRDHFATEEAILLECGFHSQPATASRWVSARPRSRHRAVGPQKWRKERGRSGERSFLRKAQG